eukprot:3529100-Ditylum_brightwellii.AAC.1
MIFASHGGDGCDDGDMTNRTCSKTSASFGRSVMPHRTCSEASARCDGVGMLDRTYSTASASYDGGGAVNSSTNDMVQSCQ